MNCGVEIMLGILGIVATNAEWTYETETKAKCGQIIKTCHSNQMAFRRAKSNSFKIPSETTIGKLGHFAGVKPLMYNLTLKFNDGKQYKGAAEILVRTKRKVKRLMIHVGDPNPRFDETTVQIQQICPKPVGSVVATTRVCIEKFVYLTDYKVLVLEFSTALLRNGEFVVSVPEFRFSPHFENRNGSTGLPSTNNNGKSMHFWFRPRNARTVFPCFDHPALKAKFNLCVEYPRSYTVHSNMPTDANGRKEIGNNRRRECFLTTPPMPTYLLGLTVTRGYKLTVSDNRPVGLLSLPKSDSAYDWVFRHADNAVRYMQNITGLRSPWPRLIFHMVYHDELVFSENPGLVSHMAYQIDVGNDLAVSQILKGVAQQWIGGILTVSNWREICLQEGLVVYLSWVLLERHGRGTTFNPAVDMARLDALFPYAAFSSIKYAESADVVRSCSFRPAVMFHMIADAYNNSVIERLASELIAKHSANAANLTVWDETLARVTGEDEKLKGFVKGWFARPGPLTLYISFNGTQITVKQRLFKQKVPSVRPVPFKLYTSNSSQPSVHVITAETEQIHLLDSSKWVLVDPDNVGLLHKTYDSRIYSQIMNRLVDDPHRHYTVLRKELFLRHFCLSLSQNLLPIEDKFDASIWEEIFSNAYQMGPICACCLLPKRDLPPKCIETAAVMCGDIKLLNMLGYS